jgi:hydrogenase maturation protease
VAAETVVVGVGNPVVSDDGVGIQVARAVAAALGCERRDVDVIELAVGGMALMEAMVGYRRAVIVDAMVRGSAPGTVHRTSAQELGETRNSTCAHGGIEPADLSTFSEQLTPAVGRAVPLAANAIVASLAIPPVAPGASARCPGGDRAAAGPAGPAPA